MFGNLKLKKKSCVDKLESWELKDELADLSLIELVERLFVTQ